MEMTESHYSLDRIVKLLAYLGDPQEQFRTIHIAGTSGKTSTSYFIRSLLEQSGKKTGLTVSPHITGINERVQISGEPLTEKKFVAYLEEFLDLVDESRVTPTYFELLAAFAYWVFAKEHVDYVVVETGLGGRLDATNTIERDDKVCVITQIGLDHTHILGDTTQKIATEKAGIIRHNNQAFVAFQDEDIVAIFRERAEHMNAKLEVINPDDSLLPASLPSFNTSNISLAHAATRYIANRDGFVLTMNPTLQAPPGRFEVFNVRGKTVVLDGAHNPQKFAALMKSLTERRLVPAHFVVAFKSSPGKDISNSLQHLLPFASSFTLTSFDMGMDQKILKSVPAGTIAEILRTLTPTSTYIVNDAKQALERALRDDSLLPIIVTGSLYLVAELRQFLIEQAAD